MFPEYALSTLAKLLLYYYSASTGARGVKILDLSVSVCALYAFRLPKRASTEGLKGGS